MEMWLQHQLETRLAPNLYFAVYIHHRIEHLYRSPRGIAVRPNIGSISPDFHAKMKWLQKRWREKSVLTRLWRNGKIFLLSITSFDVVRKIYADSILSW